MVRGNGDGFEDWGGYMEAKITKLEEQFCRSSDPFRQSNLFAGISIYVNGLTNPSADELKRIMMVHGGVYHHYQRTHTTYIIASNLPDVKIRNMDTSKIISPQWVLDCLKENKVIDYTRYLLYTNHKPSQPKLFFKNNSEIPSKVDTEHSSEHDVADIIRELNILKERMKSSPLKESTAIGSTLESKPKNQIENKTVTKHDIESPSFVEKINKGPLNNFAEKSARTAVDPKFLSEFYNNSRLHHIATLGSGFKQYVSELRERSSGHFPAREKIRKELPKQTFNNSRTIMHIDMDCFFVSVGLRSRPNLRGQPVAVTHSKSGSEPVARTGVDRQLEKDLFMKRLEEKLKHNILNDRAEKIRNGFEGQDSLSEIASCSYEAREKGVRNGMFVGQALKLCPELKTIPYDFEGYKEVAFTLYDTISQYTLNIEAVSCDEMFVDLTDILTDLQVDVMQFVEFVRREVKTKTGCPCSAGVGGNRLQARMATKRAKPDGQYLLNSDSIDDYMSNISISDLPGVGYSTSYTLKENNWITCGDLQKVSLNRLQNILGKKLGETLHQFCRGIDNRPLVYEQIRKSVSAEVNYGIRFTEYVELERFLKQLSMEVHSRLMDIKRKGKCITLKLMVRSKEAPIETSKFMGHGVCDHFSKSVSLPNSTCDLETITKTVLSIMKSLSIPPKELRGIGIQISKLDVHIEIKKDSALKNMFNKVIEKQKAKPSHVETLTEGSTSNLSVQSSQHTAKSTSPKTNDVKSSKKPPGRSKRKIKASKIPDVANMLQNVAHRKRISSLEQLQDIDMSVLTELPEDIRTEILENRAKIPKTNIVENSTIVAVKPQIATTSTTKSNCHLQKINVDKDFLDALPPDIRQEIEMEISERNVSRCTTATSTNSPSTSCKDYKNVPTCVQYVACSKTGTISENNIFRQREWRQLIQSWIDSSNCPESYDVEILSQHARELITAKKAYDLYVPVKFLCRTIDIKNSCSWHAAYKTMLSSIQMEMKNVYGAPMYLNVKINCDKCA